MSMKAKILELLREKGTYVSGQELCEQFGVSRTAAAEFTFFLAIPTMLGASAVKLIKFGFDFGAQDLMALLLGCVTAFAVSLMAIKFLMGFVKRHDFTVFGWYRIVLGIAVIALCVLL